jgi:hypothetical protein
MKDLKRVKSVLALYLAITLSKSIKIFLLVEEIVFFNFHHAL